MPRGVYSGPGRDASRRLEQTREDPERDALIAATVNNMMRRGQVVTRRDAQTLAASHGTRRGGRRGAGGVRRVSFSFRARTRGSKLPTGLLVPLPRAPESEDANEDAQLDATRSSLDETDPESEDAFGGSEPPRRRRVLRTLGTRALLRDSASRGGGAPSRSRDERRERRALAASACVSCGRRTRGDSTVRRRRRLLDPDEDSDQRRVGDVLRSVAAGAGGGAPGPSVRPESVDAARDEAVVVDGAP